jgi:hypothetical protein
MVPSRYPDSMPERSTRRRDRRPNILRRAARLVRQLFSSAPPPSEPDSASEGGVGVREPRRPLRPVSSGALALEIPPEEKRDVRAIGEDRD